MKRKILFLITALMIVLASCACVYATTYTSTASMNGNSSLAGKVRSYDAGKHKISILVKTTGDTRYNPVKITLNKKTLTGSSSKGTKTVNLATRTDHCPTAGILGYHKRKVPCHKGALWIR